MENRSRQAREAMAPKPTPIPEPLPKEEKIESLDAPEEEERREKVLNQQFRDSQEFLYGELEPSHPITQYLNGLLSRLPPVEGVTPKIVFNPGWKAVNACALPDGTIYLGTGLLLAAETEEALLGVIAHERVHAYRGHAKKQTDQRESVDKSKSMAQAVAKAVGMARAHEYEADMRGVLVDLNKAGINPLGYKAFLQKRHQQEQRGGLVHGSSLDRALNISTASYLLDLESIDADMHPIPAEVLDQARALPVYGHRSLLWSSETAAKDPKGREEEVKKRLEHAESIESRLLPLALGGVYNRVVESAVRARYEPKNEKAKLVVQENKTVFALLSQRFNKEFLENNQQSSSKEESIRSVLALFAFARVGVLAREFHGMNALLPAEREAYQASVSSREDLFTVARLFEQMEDFPLPYTLGDTGQLFRDVLSDAADRQLLGDERTPEGWIQMKEAVDVWVRACIKMAKKWEGKTYVAADFAGMTLRVFQKQERLVKNKELAVFAQEQWGEQKEGEGETGALTPLMETWVANEAEQTAVLSVDTRDHTPGALRLAQEVSRQFPEAIPAQLGSLVKRMSSRIASLRLNYAGSMSDLLGDVSRMNNVSIVAEEVQKNWSMGELQKRLAMFEYACADALLTLHPALVGKTTREKQLILFREADELFTNAVSEAKISLSAESEKEIEKFREQTPNVRTLFQPPPSSEEIPLLARYLLAWNQDETMVEISAWRTDQYTFTWVLTEYLKPLLLPEVLREVQRLDALGIKAGDLLARYSQLGGSFVEKIAQAVEDGSIDQYPPADIVRLSRFISNPFLRASFEHRGISTHWDQFTFQQKQDLIFPTRDQAGVRDPSLREQFLEESIRTKEEFHSVKEAMGQAIDDLTSEGDARAGVAVLLDIDLRHRDVNTLLSALLKVDARSRGAVGTDRQLKTFYYELFRQIAKKEDPISDAIRATEEATRNTFMADAFAKQVILRKMLISEGGVLREKKKREEFLSLLFNTWISPEPSEQDVTKVLQQIKSALGNAKDTELLYFAFQSTLADKICIPPSSDQQVPLEDLYEVEEDLIGFQKLTSGKKRKQYVDVALGKIRSKKDERVAPEAALFPAEDRLKKVLASEGYLPEAASARHSPIEFVKDSASHLGAMGVRFLQLLPQFVSVPEHRLEAFLEVFDRVKGQSKPAAIALLEREWPELWDEFDAVGDRLGGGSIVTVYRLHPKDGGQTSVARVRNPNAKYHLEKTAEFCRMMAGDLSKQFGGGYRASALAVEDIVEWIKADLAFEGFVDRDAAFRERSQGFHAEGSRYKIAIPRSRPPENPYFTVEEELVGTNLTHFDELVQAGHDMKDVASTLAKWYVQQIADGEALSDVHRGNFAVMDDDRIAVYDRGFLLQINDQEKALLFSLVSPVDDPEKKRQSLLSYFETTGSIAPTAKLTVDSQVSRLVELLATQDWKRAQGALVEIRLAGVKIPLHITLLMKNLNEIALLGAKAGFTSLTEMIVYQAE
ncbi:M48 family metalloprotease [Candidatus Uhrbacteria bacterium]|nr:M48 family metalloprotease [Candidatus Uhrbacteria bacterium]